MRRAILAALLLNAVMLAIRATQEATAEGPPRQGGNGDINGDGARDISDAVALLTYLFNGSAPPVACALTEADEIRFFELEQRVLQLEALSPSAGQKEVLGFFTVERPPGGPFIVLTGGNLQIVNGLGGTEKTDGTGNLILGYNVPDESPERSGSHNLVLGDGWDYPRFAEIRY